MVKKTCCQDPLTEFSGSVTEQPKSMHILYLVKFSQFVLKKLSGNEILELIKCHYSCKNVRKMMCNNPKLDLCNFDAYIKFGEICQFVLKILSGNEILA